MFHNLISLIILPRKRKRVCFKSINAPYSRLIVKRTLFKRFFEILISICKPTETSKNSSSALLMLNFHWTVTLQKIDVHCLQKFFQKFRRICFIKKIDLRMKEVYHYRKVLLLLNLEDWHFDLDLSQVLAMKKMMALLLKLRHLLSWMNLHLMVALNAVQTGYG